MYDFVFHYADRRCIHVVKKPAHFVASTLEEAWQKFRHAYPPPHYYAWDLEENMTDTSRILTLAYREN